MQPDRIVLRRAQCAQRRELSKLKWLTGLLSQDAGIRLEVAPLAVRGKGAATYARAPALVKMRATRSEMRQGRLIATPME
jgi:hypothetical protein